MTKPAIVVQGLGKQYRLGQKPASYGTLRDTITGIATERFRQIRRILGGNGIESASRGEWMWALKDVSFKIGRGEVVGIIGRNGAGKSTLLKILSQITEPSEGGVDLHGRVGSLLEVGTGFHPELTGRENIYLNGSILGMYRSDIDRQFDAIVAFAEIERFIDTPVKHYSSGMYLRLGFAVAAHLQPDILVVDEVLAVGDARFQQKCLAKMHEVGNQGRTVLFVSHNMPAITRICPRTILLNEGTVVADGPSTEVIGRYLVTGEGTTAVRYWTDPQKAPSGDAARLLGVWVRGGNGQITSSVNITDTAGITMEYELTVSDKVILPVCQVSNEEGVRIFSCTDIDPAWRGRPRPAGVYRTTTWIPGNFLNEGRHFVSVALFTLKPRTLQFWEREAVGFQVVDTLDPDSARGEWTGPIDGVVRPLLSWQNEVMSMTTTSLGE